MIVSCLILSFPRQLLKTQREHCRLYKIGEQGQSQCQGHNNGLESSTAPFLISLTEGRIKKRVFYWCLNRHLCILPERFAKKRPEFGHCVSQRCNVITI